MSLVRRDRQSVRPIFSLFCPWEALDKANLNADGITGLPRETLLSLVQESGATARLLRRTILLSVLEDVDATVRLLFRT